MLHRTFGARSTVRALTGLDFGLRVRVETRITQRTVFTAAEGLPARLVRGANCALRIAELCAREAQ